MKESILQRTILTKLRNHSSVIWCSRLFAGRVFGYTFNEAGTPDLVAVVDNGNGTISLLFLEVKVGSGKLRYEQRSFFERYEGKPKTMCVIINDVDQVKTLVKRAKAL